MRKNRGITMISLVVTILILLMISSVSIQVGLEVYHEVEAQNFISKLKVIQARVDNLVEETDEIDPYEFTKLSDVSDEDKNIFIDIIKNPTNYNIINNWTNEDDHLEYYYYFTSTDLEEDLGLKEQEMTVVINFKTRNVISKVGLNLDGKVYHRQYDIVAGSQLVGN